jgi:hypothetical protein
MFSADWQAELGKSPKLDYFKMNEAAGLRGQFSRERGWTEKKRDARVLPFASISRQHTAVMVEATMRHDHFERYVRNIPAIARRLAVNHPYVLLFSQVILAVAVYQDRHGINQPCDFIFDEQTGFSTR